MQETWHISPKTGFLIQPAPLSSLKGYLPDESSETLESLASQLPALLETRQFRQSVDKLPLFDISGLQDLSAIERAFQLYAFFASAYVFATGEEVVHRLPAQIAIPLVKLSQELERPPILSYAAYTLANWQKVHSDGAMEIENLRLLQKFIHKSDAAWFTLLHVEIEAEAAPAIQSITDLEAGAKAQDVSSVINALEIIRASLETMMTTLKRMPEGCHPQVYYHEVRPYIFSFEGVIYEGVSEFENRPMTFRGETGAQSSIIPALVTALGLKHEANQLTKYLIIMRDYMPKPHREFLSRIDNQPLQAFLHANKANSSLREAYNASLRALLAFRQLHLRFAASYIANQSPESLGTGGTEFMNWLQQLIDETEAQYLKA